MDGRGLKSLLAANLKHLRTERGLSQLALATELEMATNFINDLEQERKGISIDSIARIAEALAVEPYELFLPLEDLPPKTEKLLTRYTDELVAATEKAIRSVHKRFTE